MGNSSVTSSFQFISYKIDTLNLQMLRSFDLVQLTGTIDPKLWEMNIAIRPPQYFKSKKMYLGGLDIKIDLPSGNDKGSPEDKTLISLSVGIAGIFKVEDGTRLDKNLEDQLVKLQIPAILLPYARSAITSLMAHGGYGSIILPLINIHEVAKNTLANVPIAEIE